MMQPPLCKCEPPVPMVMRKSSGQETQGRRFWVCSNRMSKNSSQKCAEIVWIDKQVEVKKDIDNPSNSSSSDLKRSANDDTKIESPLKKARHFKINDDCDWEDEDIHPHSTSNSVHVPPQKLSIVVPPKSPIVVPPKPVKVPPKPVKVPPKPVKVPPKPVNHSEKHATIASSSSSNNKELNENDSQPKLGEIKCFCGETASRILTKTSTSKYYGKYFYACSKKDITKCKYWELEEDIQKNGGIPKSQRNNIEFEGFISAKKCFEMKKGIQNEEQLNRMIFYAMPDDQITFDKSFQDSFQYTAKEYGKYQVRTLPRAHRFCLQADYELFRLPRLENKGIFVKLVSSSHNDRFFVQLNSGQKGCAGFLMSGFDDDPQSYGGCADYIAIMYEPHTKEPSKSSSPIQKETCFLLINRLALWEFVSETVSDEFVQNREEAIGKKWTPTKNVAECNLIETCVLVSDLQKFVPKKTKKFVYEFEMGFIHKWPVLETSYQMIHVPLLNNDGENIE